MQAGWPVRGLCRLCWYGRWSSGVQGVMWLMQALAVLPMRGLYWPHYSLILHTQSNKKLHSENLQNKCTLTRLSTPWSKSWLPYNAQWTPIAFKIGTIWRPLVTLLISAGLRASPLNNIRGWRSDSLCTAVLKRAAPPTGSCVPDSML